MMRKHLSPKPETGLRGYKEDPICVDPAQLAVPEQLLDALGKHLADIFIPRYHHIIEDARLENPDEILAQMQETPKIIQFKAKVQLRKDGESFAESVHGELPVEYPSAQKHAQYFEAILQLRDLSLATRRLIRQRLTEQGITIAKEESPKKKGDVDLYVDDSHRAYSLVRSLQRAQGGIVKRSKKLSGVDNMTSKKRYRVTILYRGQAP